MFVYFVSIHTMGTQVRERSLGRLGADGTVSQMPDLGPLATLGGDRGSIRMDTAVARRPLRAEHLQARRATLDLRSISSTPMLSRG